MKATLVAIGGLVLTLALLAGLGLFGLEWKRYFKPRHAEIDRTVFEQTPSFVHGKIQHITRLRGDYERADTAAQRETLKTMIRHEAAVVDLSLLPPDLRNFIQSL